MKNQPIHSRNCLELKRLGSSANITLHLSIPSPSPPPSLPLSCLLILITKINTCGIIAMFLRYVFLLPLSSHRLHAHIPYIHNIYSFLLLILCRCLCKMFLVRTDWWIDLYKQYKSTAAYKASAQTNSLSHTDKTHRYRRRASSD